MIKLILSTQYTETRIGFMEQLSSVIDGKIYDTSIYMGESSPFTAHLEKNVRLIQYVVFPSSLPINSERFMRFDGGTLEREKTSKA